jgi:hypothetical protein
MLCSNFFNVGNAFEFETQIGHITAFIEQRGY